MIYIICTKTFEGWNSMRTITRVARAMTVMLTIVTMVSIYFYRSGRRIEKYLHESVWGGDDK